MDNAEKNRYIVEEVLGECWHEWEALYEEGTNYIGCKCGEVYTDLNENPNFYSTSPDEQAINFFKLWRGLDTGGIRMAVEYTLYSDNPSAALADAVIEYRKGEED